MGELTRLSVRIRPGASRNELAGLKEGVLQVRIAAPPVKGKANRQLIEFMADLLGLPKSAISIDHGETSKAKTLLIEGLAEGEVKHRLGIQELL